jgi:hypothetical protein
MLRWARAHRNIAGGLASCPGLTFRSALTVRYSRQEPARAYHHWSPPFRKTLFGQLAEGIHHGFDFVLRHIGRHDEAESSIGPVEQLHSIAIDPVALLPANSCCIWEPARRYNRQLSRLLEYAELFPMVSENQADSFS